ncbi:hypothetical protein GUJ93_ZPchr0006g43173 [Zizania palustris]|uniref:EF-hand domain-containing protein n=1 Tax=Zizania palustris TaxID=103762 RepID=A0A8J5SFN1_ZIZPA|nr:hypothetical protein GUJ93_ZPchr0006g43173 [Zizania palustris]
MKLNETVMRGDEAANEASMREAFGVFNQNGDGFITVDELRVVLASLGIEQDRTLDECSRMIGHVDRKGDGRVSISPSSSR